MPERSANISTHDSFGSLLGYAPGGIAIYSSDYHTADEKRVSRLMPPFAVI